MESIRSTRPADRALVHGIGAVLLQAEGRLPEAESEYLLAVRAWEDAGKSESADAGAIYNSLGTIYIGEQRLEDARRALDRALTIFTRAKDSVPMDRIKVLHVRGVLLALQGAWQESEQELREALAMADRQPWEDKVALRSLLVAYAHVLRRNHHGREARPIEARAAGIHQERSAVVDVTELLARPKPAKK
jgi:tetratricopeptide (TPR) repeat protein